MWQRCCPWLRRVEGVDGCRDGSSDVFVKGLGGGTGRDGGGECPAASLQVQGSHELL